MGWPAPRRMAMSTSATDASPRSTIMIAAAMLGTRSRLTMKPGVSWHSTVVLPQLFAHASAAKKTASLVCAVRTTSTSGLQSKVGEVASERCVSSPAAAVVSSPFVRVGAAHELYWVEEVEPHEQLGPARGLCHWRDLERGSIRGEDALRAGDLAKGLVESFFDGQVLYDCFDDQVDVRQRVCGRRKRQVRHRLFRLLRRGFGCEGALGGELGVEFGDRGLNVLPARLEHARVGVDAHHSVPCCGGSLCDAVAHQPHAHDPDALDAARAQPTAKRAESRALRPRLQHGPSCGWFVEASEGLSFRHGVLQ
mmetsp:Transcript_22216/g.79198  ORF Transcript_22216/g.79198 Transcript_22216/m.79198 type:complete len:309 (+) Transcript_22216:306-1232(+)